ncbi:UDP-glucuronic acid decarboxylase family protein [Celeribacter litoreus]|uniref:UDP-glucuronic acid decarboxylase family protein n=1 Tax=Celeribacter litoreus TaxID=2876714 RepID=UPI001CCB6A18|nr:UDP-glucuronic acid decarboxylase family protein [Celeribacter litoreus]MCA0045099.1 SDR family oxidoreductase [Celeribacter litoreus]
MFGKKTFTLRFDQGDSNVRHTVLVAGGAGFIGSNLIRVLLEEGDRVICLDDLSTGRHGNISDLIAHPRFRFILHDIVEPFTLSMPVDQIYNLACPASPPKYQYDPLQTFKTSVIGALNLLELAREKRARILQSSTSEVYGDPDHSPQEESYRGNVATIGPRACYDEGKRAAETLFYEMHQVHGVDVRIARIFNTYGPWMDPSDGRVVSNFVVQALCEDPLTVYGDGTQTRSFCYVSDMVAGLMALMNAPEVLGTISDPVNLGNADEFTMLELAELVLEKTGSRSPLVHKPLPKHDPLQRRPDLTRAQNLLGWRPKVSLSEGLSMTIDYFAGELVASQERRRVEEGGRL